MRPSLSTRPHVLLSSLATPFALAHLVPLPTQPSQQCTAAVHAVLIEWRQVRLAPASCSGYASKDSTMSLTHPVEETTQLSVCTAVRGTCAQKQHLCFHSERSQLDTSSPPCHLNVLQNEQTAHPLIPRWPLCNLRVQPKRGLSHSSICRHKAS